MWDSTKICTYCFKKKIIVNPCESQSENYMSYVKKSQLFKKNIKLRIEAAEDPQKHIFKSIFDFENFFALRSEKKYFFQKADIFSH